MKKLLLTLALATAGLCAAAQTTSGAAVAPAATAAAPAAAPAGYAELLGATVQAVTNTGDAAELRALAAKLERAAAVAPADWLPRYYQSYALLISVFQGHEAAAAKDQLLDQAEAALATARRLHGDESELLTLQAYIYQARLGVAPQERAQQYTGQVYTALGAAQQLNPANPRAYLVRANQVFYTPPMFGGGAGAARPLYELAKAKFAASAPADALAPAWGLDQVLRRLKQYDTAVAPAAH